MTLSTMTLLVLPLRTDSDAVAQIVDDLAVGGCDTEVFLGHAVAELGAGKYCTIGWVGGVGWLREV